MAKIIIENDEGKQEVFGDILGAVVTMAIDPGEEKENAEIQVVTTNNADDEIILGLACYGCSILKHNMKFRNASNKENEESNE